MRVEQFLQPISLADLRACYNIEATGLSPALCAVDNGSTTLQAYTLGKTHDGDKLQYVVALFCEDGEPILDQGMERWLCASKLCLGRPQERTKVAVRVRFYIRKKYQRCSLATHLFPREEGVFHAWGAREVQTCAMDDGRWVWTRPRFGYEIPRDEFELLQEKYKEWQ